MQTVVEYLREVIGIPEFYVRLGNQTNYTWDYGAMLEYCIAGVLVIIVVGSVFRIIKEIFA